MCDVCVSVYMWCVCVGRKGVWVYVMRAYDMYRRCLVSILSNFYTPDIISDPKYKFSSSGSYHSPPKSDYENYVEFIRELPMLQAPEVFGMDDNVDISKELQETREVGYSGVHVHTTCI